MKKKKTGKTGKQKNGKQFRNPSFNSERNRRREKSPVENSFPVSENQPKGPLLIQNQCVGILREAGKDGLVEPDPGYDGRQYGRILIPGQFLNGAPYGMKVVCEIMNPQESGGNYFGKIIEVLGDPMRHDVAILSIMRQFGLQEQFSASVLQESEKVPMTLSDKVLEAEFQNGRRDLRDLKTITIDGADAKDLDDAISIERISSSGFRLYVHIADVSHYVQDGSALDTEARLRGTSVYLSDRVVPMLPPRLSNNICSLNPFLPRLTLSASMEIDRSGNVLSGEIIESVIQSDARTTYEGIQLLLDGKNESDEYIDLTEMVNLMKELADILIIKRTQRGALEFSFPETHVELDSDGKPLTVNAYPIYYSNRIIEEFMILCNEYVAGYFWKKNYPFIYRVHEDPNPEKINTFLEVAELYGKKIKVHGKITPRALSVFLADIKEEAYYPAVSQLLLRSLAKAEYKPENLEHFGLASECYCHFTSPIRRYPDLYIHRIIKSALHRKRKKKYFEEQVEDVCRHSSDMERNAIDAERASIAQKIVEYMAEHVGEVYEGKISGMFHSGMFVQLKNTIEGMIPFRIMPDYFHFDERRLEAVGKQSGKIWHIGDSLSVQVARADALSRQIDFVLLDSTGNEKMVKNKKSRVEKPEKSSGKKNLQKKKSLKKKTSRKKGKSGKKKGQG